MPGKVTRTACALVLITCAAAIVPSSSAQTQPRSEYQKTKNVPDKIDKFLIALSLAYLKSEGPDAGPYGRVNTNARNEAIEAEEALFATHNVDNSSLNDAQKEAIHSVPGPGFETALNHMNPDALKAYLALKAIARQPNGQTDPTLLNALSKCIDHMDGLIAESIIYNLRGRFDEPSIQMVADDQFQNDLAVLAGRLKGRDLAGHARQAEKAYNEHLAMQSWRSEAFNVLRSDIQASVAQTLGGEGVTLDLATIQGLHHESGPSASDAPHEVQAQQGQICTSRRIRGAMQLLEQEAIKDPNGAMLSALAGLITGVNASARSARILDSKDGTDGGRYTSQDAGSFVCRGLFVHGDVKIDTTDDADAASEMTADAMQAIMNTHPTFVEWFKVKPLGNGTYWLTLLPLSIQLSREYGRQFVYP